MIQNAHRSPAPAAATVELPPVSACTAGGLIAWAERILEERSVESPRLSARWMMESLLRERSQPPSGNEVLRGEEISSLELMVRRRLEGEPLQYVLGETVFMGLSLRLDRRVFIPRPETEILVESAVRVARSFPAQNLSVLDIGTGSGNIAISLAKLLPNCRVTAADSSQDALQVAGENLRLHGLEGRVTLRKCDILLEPECFRGETYDILISNPPYVSAREYSLLQREIRDFEPPEAVTDFGDGHCFYRRIAHIGRRILSGGGWVALEMAYNQRAGVERIFAEHSYRGIETIRDYSGTDRVLLARTPLGRSEGD